MFDIVIPSFAILATSYFYIIISSVLTYSTILFIIPYPTILFIIPYPTILFIIPHLCVKEEERGPHVGLHTYSAFLLYSLILCPQDIG